MSTPTLKRIPLGKKKLNAIHCPCISCHTLRTAENVLAHKSLLFLSNSKMQRHSHHFIITQKDTLNSELPTGINDHKFRISIDF